MYNTACISRWKMNRRLLIFNFAFAMIFYMNVIIFYMY